jgi:hypothetical protein
MTGPMTTPIAGSPDLERARLRSLFDGPQAKAYA